MIPVTIVSRVEIPTISEEVIANLIKAEILKSNPELQINEITFERKLTPSRIVANVDAQMKGTVSEATEQKQEELPLEAQTAEPTAEEPTETEKPVRKKVFG